MPFERVRMLYNALISLLEQEKKAVDKQQQDNGTMNPANMQGLMKNPMSGISNQANSLIGNAMSNFKMPSIGSFHL
mgnify:FL=1